MPIDFRGLYMSRGQFLPSNRLSPRGRPLEACHGQVPIAIGATYRALVAFSGEVTDHEQRLGPFTEKSPSLNGALARRDIREAFDTDAFRILIVANKYKTGFDQPLLCGMYDDKSLGGIQAVQTLSRFNRSYKGQHGQKDTTYVMDFQNQADEILEAFNTYYETAQLSAETDPNILLDSKTELDATGRFDQHEVERVVTVDLIPKSRQQDLDAAIQPVAQRLLAQFKTAPDAHEAAVARNDSTIAEVAMNEMDLLVKFKSNLGAYLRLHTFLCQIYDFGLTDVEKKAVFFRYLIKLLAFSLARPKVDHSKIRLTHFALRRQHATLEGHGTILIDRPNEASTGGVREVQKEWLYNVIASINDLFEGELTDGDMVNYVSTIRASSSNRRRYKRKLGTTLRRSFSNRPTCIMNSRMPSLAHSTPKAR